MKTGFLIFFIFVIPSYLFSQDTSNYKLFGDTNFLKFDAIQLDEITPTGSGSFSSIDYILNRSPSNEHSSIVKQNNYLVGQAIDSKNYKNYYNLGISLYEMDSIEKAKEVFSNILNSDSSFYSNSINYSSDIPGDTSSNTYGYGSYSFNYKNKCCLFLAKILLIQEEFDSASGFLNLAKNKYKAQYNCGTGHNMYQSKLDGLTTLCLQGKGEFKALIKLNLVTYHENVRILVQAIKEVYSDEQIKDSLVSAVKSLRFELNEYLTTVTTFENYGKIDEKRIEYKYHNGTATILLFGEIVEVQSIFRLKENEVATKQMYLDRFKNSIFYQDLLVAEH